MITAQDIETVFGFEPFSISLIVEGNRPRTEPPLTPAQQARLLAAWPDGPLTATPAEVTNAQFRLALIDSGIMPDSVLAAIRAIADPVARARSLALWEYANHIQRANPLIAQLAPAFNLTDAQVDDLFRLAATL